jgi:hypothetical protein
MTVFVVEHHYDHEGFSIAGIFPTLAKADAAARGSVNRYDWLEIVEYPVGVVIDTANQPLMRITVPWKAGL